MANIPKLDFSFVDGQTTIHDYHLNAMVDRINQLIDAAGGVIPTQTVATPAISISGTTATISCSTSGATIYYTLNGNTPTTSSTQYSSPITLSGACTIKAIAVKSGMNNSSVASAEYNPSATVQPPAIYIRDLAIIMTAESGATIYYTTDGSTPTANSTQYTNAFTLPNNATVKAIAIKNGSSSSVASASFTAPQRTEQDYPQIVVEGNKATILSNGIGTISYAFNSESSFVSYTEPITLTGNCTIKARTSVDGTHKYAKVLYSGESVITNLRYSNIFDTSRINRAASTESSLQLDVNQYSSLRFYPVVSGRKYVVGCHLGISSSAYWGYASEVPSAVSETITIQGKYLSDTVAPSSSDQDHDFYITAENYAYIATSSGASDLQAMCNEIIKE